METRQAHPRSRRPADRLPLFVVLALAASFAAVPNIQAAGDDTAAAAKKFSLSTKGLTVRLSEDGRIVAAAIGASQPECPVQAYHRLDGCERSGPVRAAKSPDGSLVFEQRLVHSASRAACTLREQLHATTDSIRWEIEITGEAEPWCVPIETHLDWPNNSAPAKFWLPQSGEVTPNPPLHFMTDKLGDRKLPWSDPLRARAVSRPRTFVRRLDDPRLLPPHWQPSSRNNGTPA